MIEPFSAAVGRKPPLEYERAPCPVCGAATTKDAETRCLQFQDVTGEYICQGGMSEDEDGHLTAPTAASVKAVDEWCDAEAKRLGWM